MADVHSPEIRSYNMSQIKGKDTKPEVAVRRYLFSEGFRYRKNVKKLPGCPDIVLRRYKTCIFINGCFWHKHEGCKYFVWPMSNTDFWRNKIETNVLRDKRNYEALENLGWKIIVVWECEIKKDFKRTMEQLKISIISD
jgi:DNA mismatch endonuclease (patch repair protein)